MIKIVKQAFLRFLVLCLGSWILLDIVARLGAELFWFQEVNYLPVFLLRLTMQGVLWVVVTAITIFYFRWNLKTAHRLKYPPLSIDTTKQSDPHFKWAQTSASTLYPLQSSPRNGFSPDPLAILALRFRTLIPLAFGLSLLVGLILIH